MYYFISPKWTGQLHSLLPRLTRSANTNHIHSFIVFVFSGKCSSKAIELWCHFACNLKLNGKDNSNGERERLLPWYKRERKEKQNTSFWQCTQTNPNPNHLPMPYKCALFRGLHQLFFDCVESRPQINSLNGNLFLNFMANWIKCYDTFSVSQINSIWVFISRFLSSLNCRLTAVFLFSILDSKKHFRLPNGDLIIFKLNPSDKQSLYTCSVTNLVTQEQIYSQTFSIKLEGKEQNSFRSVL